MAGPESRLGALYYSLGLRADPETETAVQQTTAKMEQLSQVAREAGLPVGALEAAIVRMGAESAQTIDRVIQLVEEQGRELDATSRKAVEAYRNQADSAAAYLVKLGATDQQLDRIGAAIQSVEVRAGASGKELTGFGRSGQRATLQVAYGLEQLARTGGEAFGSLRAGVSSIALMMGKGSVLVAAISAATIAIVELFVNARREIDKTRREWQGLIQDLQGTDARRVASEIAKLERGDPRAEKEGDRKSLAQLRRERDEALRRLEEARRPTEDGVLNPIGIRRAEAELAAIQRTTAAREAQHAQLRGLMQVLAETEVIATESEERERKRRDAAREAASQQKRDTKELTQELERQAKTHQQLAAALEAEVAKLSASQVDDLRAAHEQLIRTLRAELATLTTLSSAERAYRTEQIDGLEAALAEQRKAVEFLEDLEPDVGRILSPLRTDTYRQIGELDALLAKVRRELSALTRDSVAYEQVAKRLRDLEGERRELVEDANKALTESVKETVAGAIEAIEAGNKRLAKETERQFHLELRRADAIQDAVLGTFELASALAGASEQAEALLRPILTMATQIPKVVSTLRGLDLKDDDGNPLSTLSDVIGSVLPIIGGITSLIGALGRREDPEARRRAEILAENNRRLAELRDGLAAAVRITTSGRDLANVAGASFTRQRLELFGNPLAPEGGIRFTTGPATAPEILGALQAAGTSFGDLRQIAEDFNITLSEMPTVAELRQLQQAIREWQFGAFAKTFSGQLEALNTEFQLFDITDPAEQLRRFIGLVTNPEFGAPAIAEALQGIADPTSAEGIAASRAALQELFLQVRSGTLDAEAFAALIGNLTPEEFLDALTRLDELFRSLTPVAKTAVQVLAAALDAIDVAAEFGALSPAEALAQQIGAIKAAFGELVAPIDFSSLAAFRETVKAVITAITADGELTEDEQALAAALRGLLAAYDAAIEKTPTLAEIIDGFFGQLAEGAEILGTSTQDQLDAALTRFRTEFGGDLLEGIDDPFSATGRAQLQQRLRDAYSRLLADGISEEERPLVSAIRQMLRLITTVADEQTAAIEQLAQKASAALRAVFEDLDFELELDGVTDPLERLQRTATKLAGADARIAGALGGIDLTTAEGRAAAEAALKALGAGSTDKDLQASILAILRAIRNVPLPEGPAAAELPKELKPGQAQAITATALLTAVGGDRLLSLLSQIVDHTRTLVELFRLSLGAAPVHPPATATPFFLPAGGAGGGAGGVTLQLQLNFYAPVTTGDPQELARQLALEVIPITDRELGVRYKGERRNSQGSAAALVK